MRVLALDLSTKTGWAWFVDEKLIDFGTLETKVDGFNLRTRPERHPNYPWNIFRSTERVSEIVIYDILLKMDTFPDVVVIENTVKGKNRHTQRILEWIHCWVLHKMSDTSVVPVMPTVKYIDPSEWRHAIGAKMSVEEKKHNKEIIAAGKRGKISKKHVTLRVVNEKWGMKLRPKDNNTADAIGIGWGWCVLNPENK